MKMLVKEITTKLLVSGDKSARIILETISQADIKELVKLSDEIEIEVEFDNFQKKE